MCCALWRHRFLLRGRARAGLHPAAVSQQMKALEASAGTPCSSATAARSSDPGRRGAGAARGGHPRRLTAAEEEVAAIGTEAGRSASSPSRAAVPPSCPPRSPPAAAHPGTRVSLEEAEPPESVETLRARDCDIALRSATKGPPRRGVGRPGRPPAARRPSRRARSRGAPAGARGVGRHRRAPGNCGSRAARAVVGNWCRHARRGLHAPYRLRDRRLSGGGRPGRRRSRCGRTAAARIESVRPRGARPVTLEPAVRGRSSRSPCRIWHSARGGGDARGTGAGGAPIEQDGSSGCGAVPQGRPLRSIPQKKSPCTPHPRTPPGRCPRQKWAHVCAPVVKKRSFSCSSGYCPRWPWRPVPAGSAPVHEFFPFVLVSPPHTPYGSRTASAWAAHSARTGHLIQTSLAEFSRALRAALVRPPEEEERTVDSTAGRMELPVHRSAFGPGRRRNLPLRVPCCRSGRICVSPTVQRRS